MYKADDFVELVNGDVVYIKRITKEGYRVQEIGEADITEHDIKECEIKGVLPF